MTLMTALDAKRHPRAGKKANKEIIEHFIIAKASGLSEAEAQSLNKPPSIDPDTINREN